MSPRGFRRHLPALGVAFPVKPGEPEEAVLALAGDGSRRAVGAKEIVDVEFVERDQARDHARHLGMSRQRAVLGPRQRQPRLHFRKDCRGTGDRSGGPIRESEGANPCHQRYPDLLTNS